LKEEYIKKIFQN